MEEIYSYFSENSNFYFVNLRKAKKGGKFKQKISSIPEAQCLLLFVFFGCCILIFEPLMRESIIHCPSPFCTCSKLPSGNLMPPLFDWSDHELEILEPALLDKLQPRGAGGSSAAAAASAAGGGGGSGATVAASGQLSSSSAAAHQLKRQGSTQSASAAAGGSSSSGGGGGGAGTTGGNGRTMRASTFAAPTFAAPTFAAPDICRL